MRHSSPIGYLAILAALSVTACSSSTPAEKTDETTVIGKPAAATPSQPAPVADRAPQPTATPSTDPSPVPALQAHKLEAWDQITSGEPRDTAFAPPEGHPLAGKQLLGAHCVFSAEWSDNTSIVNIIAERADHGDTLYVEGGTFVFSGEQDTEFTAPNYNEVTGEQPPLRVDRDRPIRCVYRPGQLDSAAVIVPVRLGNQALFGLIAVDAPNDDDRRTARWVRLFETPDKAMANAEEAVPPADPPQDPGDPLPYVMWQSYFGGSQDFCPLNQQCPE